MLRSPLYQDDYRPQLSGHETFPIRYGWLKKAFDRVLEYRGPRGQPGSFLRLGCHRPVRRGQEHGFLDAPLGQGGRDD